MALLDHSNLGWVAPVTVIVPCYCCTSTIQRAIESVALQALLPAEVILVDDCSPDDTLAELYRLQSSYQEGWIRVVSLRKNGGPSVARNAGWREATQPYLAFLDADDSWHPQKIQIQYQWMASHHEVILTGHGFTSCRDGKQQVLSANMNSSLSARNISRLELLLSNRFCTPTVMLKADCGFRFDEDKRYAEDYLLWLKIRLSGGNMVLLQVDLAYLHKAPYGAGGLSAALWAMEKGELAVYQRLYLARMISCLELTGLVLLSFVKYVRRVFVVQLQPRERVV